MAQIDRRKLQSALESKGFVKRDNDHEFYDLRVDGKKVGIQTKISRSPKFKVYEDSLLGAMARQLRISKDEMMRLAGCTLSGAAYLALLRQANIIE